MSVHSECVKRYRETPRGKYQVHKQNARARGVEFALTFEQWWQVWKLSGKWSRRGNSKGKYMMMRHADEGAYVLGNVRIGKMESNVAERNRTVRKKHTRKWSAVTFVEGVEFTGSTYGAVDAPF